MEMKRFSDLVDKKHRAYMQMLGVNLVVHSPQDLSALSCMGILN